MCKVCVWVLFGSFFSMFSNFLLIRSSSKRKSCVALVLPQWNICQKRIGKTDMFVVECGVLIQIWRGNPISFGHVSSWCFVFWSSKNHVLVTYRGPIKKIGHLRPIYLTCMSWICWLSCINCMFHIRMRSGSRLKKIVHLRPTRLRNTYYLIGHMGHPKFVAISGLYFTNQ